VTALLPELDSATRTRTVVFHIDRAGASNIVPGQTVRTCIARRLPADGYWLPTAALARGSHGLWSALAVCGEAENRRLQRRDVEVLYSDGPQVLVRGTLTAGDLILAGGVHRLVPGQAVEVESIIDGSRLAAGFPGSRADARQVAAGKEPPTRQR